MARTWQTVRVFISSTFRDMHAERDHLVKVVFPELRELCAKQRLHLIDLDLRWGVTEEEAEQGKVLELVLEGIDRARPFFIAILGERYGFVPEKILEDAEFVHTWLKNYPGHSITALEIIHGVLRNTELAKKSFFYFRDPLFIPHVPESKRVDFIAENPEAARKLAALKDKIRASNRPLLENYPCRWDNVAGHLKDLDTFGQHVLKDLWGAICEEFPEDVPEADPIDIERQMHEAFVEERSHLHVGRAAEAGQLTEYVQGEDPRPIVITGESGCGKSSFLAKWYRQYAAEHLDDFVLASFIGASPDSTNHLLLLRNMCEELKRKFSLKEEIPEKDEKLPETLAILLRTASQGERKKLSFRNRLLRRSQRQTKRRRIIVLLDALDQLSKKEETHGLGWLLDYIPEDVRLVVSSLEGDCLDALRRHGAQEIMLPTLSRDEQWKIVQARLSEWRRKLDDRQMEILLAHKGVKNPLFLRIALEELKLFGIFEQLTKRIKELADDIPSLFKQVLERLEKDHGQDLVTEAFILLDCSRYGLSEVELLDLLCQEGEDQFPRGVWARLVRSARAYLLQRGELFGFFHRQLEDAVATRYMRRDNKHAKLAVYFKHAPLDRKLDEYPYQLQQAEKWQDLAAALSDLDFFDYAWEHNRKYEWMGYWRSMKEQFEPDECYQAAVTAREKVQGETQDVARLLNRIGIFLSDMGITRPGLHLIERALSILERILGPNHPQVAASLNNLATLHLKQRMSTEAIPLIKRAMAIEEKSLSPDHPQLASSLSSLAALYKEQGKYSEALPLLKRVLAIKESTLGPDHVEVAVSLNNLAGFYKMQGKHAKALSLYQRALAIKERILGPNHPQVAIALNNLAGVYKDQGNFAKAVPLYKQALTIKEHALGTDHRDIATILNNLGISYKGQGKYAAAMPFLERALTIEESALGPDHSDVATSLNNLAETYKDVARYAEALPLYQRALEINERSLGRDHPEVATSLNNLALLYCEQRKSAEALPLLERAVTIAEATLGANHYRTQAFKKNLLNCRDAMSPKKTPYHDDSQAANDLNQQATFLYKQGKYAEAQPLIKQALAINERVLNPGHPEIAIGLNNLAMVYRKQGKHAEALPLLKRALAIQESTLGPEHPHVAASLNNLGGFYISKGRYTEALPLLERALAIREGALGPEHPNVANSLNSVAEVYRKQNKYAEAVPLYQRAVAIAEVTLGPDHFQTKVFRANLKACHESMQ